jgi:UDP-glucose 4-epimerase
MRVLVTGASGFIGRHVVAALLAADHGVTTLQRGDGPAGAEQVRADVLSAEARTAARRAEAVVHLAGRGDVQASFREPFDYNRLNALGTLNVLEGARDVGAHVVLASTQRVYRPRPARAQQAGQEPRAAPLREDAPLDPADPYAVSKLVAERWCSMYSEQLGLPTTTVRLFSVYGPGQVGQGSSGVVSIFLDRARRGEPLVVQAAQRRDLTFVEDVARGIRLALERPPEPGRARLCNLATGVGTSLERLAELVRRAVNSTSPIVPPPHDAVEGDRVADVTRAQHELGFRASVSVEEGVRRLAAGTT